MVVEEGGARLDLWISKQLQPLSRRSAQAFLLQGNVKVNGRVAGKSQLLELGDSVEILKEPAPKNWRPLVNPSLSLDVLHKDDSFLVVNKPGGMPSTAIGPDDSNTLANAVVTHFPECAAIGARNGDAGLLHRLDNDTSGVLIVARNVRAYKALRIQQESNQIEKRYVALVAAIENDKEDALTAPSTISVPLDATRKGGKKMAVVKGGQKAVTHIEDVAQKGNGAFSLVNVLIYRGVRHQIRVHLAQRGFPICGDSLYRGPSAPQLERLFLHAVGVKFFHPVLGTPVEVHCPLPKELQHVISVL